MNKEDKSVIINIILFLKENEQYGDNWKNEIRVLKELINKNK